MCVLQKAEQEKLIMEKSQLGQLKLKTCHNVSTLCQKVCREAKLQPEQLHVLAKYTSPDCPLSSVLPHIDALLSQHGLQARASLSGCSTGRDDSMLSGEVQSPTGRDTAAGEGQH